MLSINKIKFVRISLILSFIFPSIAFSLPMEWHGVFAVDTHNVQNFRFTDDNNDDITNYGSQETPEAPAGRKNAAFQSYIIKLRPSLILNDSASFFAELTTGYARGGFYGDGPKQNLPNSFGNALYFVNFADNQNPVNLNQFYMELYSDTATYQIGRAPDHIGLGLIVSEGSGTWDRFATVRDQLKVKFKLGNFSIDPFIGKVGSGTSLTSSTEAYEFGVPLMYEVAETDMTFGISWIMKKLSGDFNGYRFNMDMAPTNPDWDTDPLGGWNTLGSSTVNLIDVYFKKIWGNFELELEVPVFTGHMGDLYKEGEETKYFALAAVLQMAYKFNESWNMGLDGGYVSGDKGTDDSYDAMYLNPNFKIANILFGYNNSAISQYKVNPLGAAVQSPFDVYVTNTSFAKVYGGFITGKWDMNLALIWAMANEVAVKDEWAYNHQTNKRYLAEADQDKQLGFEIDYGLDYAWNDEIHIGLNLAYLLAGDYWAFTNTDDPLDLKNPWLFRLMASLDF